MGHYHLVAFALNSLGVQVEDDVAAESAVSGTGRLAGRTVLVVGGGSRATRRTPVGNGRAIVTAAARARVVCADRDGKAADETAALVADAGGTSTVVVADVRDEAACASLVGAAVEAGGGALDGVVLNVGIGRGGGLAHTSAEDWDVTFARQPRATWWPGDAADGRGGAFVFVSSLAGLQPGSLPAYDASKAGLLGLSRHVAMEGARRASGPTWWPRADRHPLGRVATRGRPSRGQHPARPPGHGLGGGLGHVLPAVGRGGYITGQVLAVDGGLSLVDRQRPTSGATSAPNTRSWS